MTYKQGDTVYIPATVLNVDNEGGSHVECRMFGERCEYYLYASELLPAPPALTPEQVEVYRGAIALAAGNGDLLRHVQMSSSKKLTHEQCVVQAARSIMEAVTRKEDE